MKILTAVLAGALLLGMTACGEADTLKARVQELENERSEMTTQLEGLKTENADLKEKLTEIEEQNAAMMASMATDTAMMDTHAAKAPTVPATSRKPTTMPSTR